MTNGSRKTSLTASTHFFIIKKDNFAMTIEQNSSETIKPGAMIRWLWDHDSQGSLDSSKWCQSTKYIPL